MRAEVKTQPSILTPRSSREGAAGHGVSLVHEGFGELGTVSRGHAPLGTHSAPHNAPRALQSAGEQCAGLVLLLCPPPLVQADTNLWDQAHWAPLGAAGVLLLVPPSATVLLLVLLPSDPLASGFCLDFDLLPPALLQHTFPASKGFHTTTQLADPSPCCSEALELWGLELHWDSKPASRLHTITFPSIPRTDTRAHVLTEQLCVPTVSLGESSAPPGLTHPSSRSQLRPDELQAMMLKLPPRCLARRRQPNPMGSAPLRP